MTIKLGPFVDAADGATAETALSISQADIRISKNGGDFAQSNNSAGASHDENGYYDVPLDTTDTGALGRLRVSVTESGARPVWQDFMVVPANVYDSLVGGARVSDKLQVDVAQFGDTNGTFSGGRPEVNATHVSGNSAAADNIEVVFATDFATNYNTTDDGWVVKLGDYGHGGASAILGLESIGLFSGFVVGGDVDFNSFNIGACEITGAISATNASNDIRGIGSFTTAGKAELQQEAADALNAYDPPTRAEANSDRSEILTAVDGVPTAAEIRTELDGNSTQLAAIVADTNELQTDWANGGRLDNILDARASQASVDALLKSLILVSGGKRTPPPFLMLACGAGY